MSILDEKQMEGESAEDQARKAIRHALTRVHDHELVGYYMGIGGQAFSLLTEAYATLTGEPVESIREAFKSRNPMSASEYVEQHGS